MAYTCPKCGMTSHNPNDEREQYCGNCHDWTWLPAPKAENLVLTEAMWDETLEKLSLKPSDFGVGPDPFTLNPAVWVGNNDGTCMAWWCINGVWQWRHLSADNKVLAEGEGSP